MVWSDRQKRDQTKHKLACCHNHHNGSMLANHQFYFPNTLTTSSTRLPFAFAFSALVMGAIAMGISPVFVRLAEVGPFASAFWRVSLALPFLFIWLWLEARQNAVSLRNTLVFDKAVLLTGVFFAGDLFFWHLSILNTTIANATLLSCLAPVWVALFSGAFIGEPVNRNTLVGLLICLVGAAFLIGGSFSVAPERLLGDIYGFLTSIFFGLYFLAVRVARRTHGTGALTFMGGCVTAAMLLAITLLAGQGLWPQTMAGVAALFALGLVSHIGGQGLLTLALGALSATFSSLVIFIEAVAAAFFGWLIFTEALEPIQIAGGSFILVGIWIARPRS